VLLELQKCSVLLQGMPGSRPVVVFSSGSIHLHHTVLHQKTAWKAGHKHMCCAPGKGAAGLTAPQRRLKTRLFELQDADDWLGVLALEKEALALARELRGADPGLAGKIHGILGLGFYSTGDYVRARIMHEKHKAMAEALGDRAGVARACSNLGCCYESTGDYGRARELHELRRAMAEAMGDRAGVARAYANLGNCYKSTGDYVRARELHEQARALDEALGDRTGVARACCNIGNCYQSTGEYARAIELHEQDMAMCEALGDRAGVARACCNLGVCYADTGDYGRARELYEQHSAMAKTLGDRQGVATACGNLGDCCLQTGEYARAISYFTEQYDIAKDMLVERGHAALGIGVALRLEVRASVRGRAVGASQLPGPDVSTSACSDDGVREAEKWLQTALDSGHTAAHLHLARLAFDVGLEDTALAHLRGYLSSYVQNGRIRCAGCDQTRGEDAQMLTCGGCRVARFCSADHQKMASKSVAVGGSLLAGRHRDVCDVLGKWRVQVVKHGMSPDVLRSDLLAFLRQ
jgi:tetratricopeptide (TPR) repeat protein